MEEISTQVISERREKIVQIMVNVSKLRAGWLSEKRYELDDVFEMENEDGIIENHQVLKIQHNPYLMIDFVFYKCIKSKKEYIKKWIELALKKTKNTNKLAPSSYGLKHLCESSIGVYVSNHEMKQCMNEMGFKSVLQNGVNEIYNISSNINNVVFINKLGNFYQVKRNYLSDSFKIEIEF
jgi:hypothetical protein